MYMTFLYHLHEMLNHLHEMLNPRENKKRNTFVDLYHLTSAKYALRMLNG